MEEVKEEKFEDLLVKLEGVANNLESGKLDLNESINSFEEGIKLSKLCNKKLDEAEKKIKILLENDESGTEEDFN